MNRQFESNFLLQLIVNIYIWLGCLLIGSSAEVGSTGLRLKPGEGIESVDGFCRGLNGLDQFADIASQLLNQKYPMLGPIRVSVLWT